ncbi:glutamine--fructose-6-phosphate transaminase (isomerizing) [Waddlia chondrophila]|uniref:Glutamine--fructose-6-phosphate aminotransferase [isomerizing] n=1 Tax=Waddlia chondrophila (strain ATCC VR-1470 / WSU 86-1044) TaxID=716544 RepID=D6YUH7_WADCW|nr:glutamine--fructose-6-phosphate transaminase (isomerizing) [Waddlia chondrophila]ADI37788.1 glucosamine--fructose-6-phosphate aminotransferase (isomerizing) [Waddlia chondrophila WSU 86-1044]
MCGIFGYVGKKNSVKIAIEGLKRLEYRGYDSAGIAGVSSGQLFACKEVGKVAILETIVEKADISLDAAIAHTRWATHGKPSGLNAHPHLDTLHSLAVVHNGIVENHDTLRRHLMQQGVAFESETDTEVIAHLVSSFYEGDLLKAVKETIPLLEGSFAIALVHKDYPDQIIAVAHESPLVIGIGEDEAFISSDSHAFISHTREVVFLSNSEIAVVTPDKLEIFNTSLQQIQKEREILSIEAEEISKKGYQHYTLKEINEQPQSIRNALLSRYFEDYGTAVFEELTFDVNELLSIQRVLILACGTSWHAGCVGSYLIEDMARIPVQVEISSEFRYKNPIVPPGTFVVAVSQSGETADTIAALRELKAKAVKVLGICNVHSSTLARECDCTIFLKAGPEIGVCSTKAFVSQVVVFSLFSLLLARMRHMSKADGQEFIQALKVLPEQVQKVLNQADAIQSLAKKYAKYDNFFYLGRHYMFPTALEGALKLKEISYINANGYPAGEMKHGPIALIGPDCPTVAFCANRLTYDKLLSNLMEIKSRSGPIIAISEEGSAGIDSIADDVIWVPASRDEIAVVPTTVAAQLFAYYVALERGEDIDQPRNLAKSVTVE